MTAQSGDQDELIATARAWVDGDPDPKTRDQLQGMIDARDLDGLRRCCAHPLRFGTAGLRGIEGPGPAQMNRAVVLRTSWGLASFVTRVCRTPTVVVGYDARRNSHRYALDVAGTLATQGIVVLLFDSIVPTPLVAFEALRRKAAAAVCITASHNPKQYAGYKIYGSSSSQLGPPEDLAVLAAIDAAPLARRIAAAFAQVMSPSVCMLDTEAVLSAYQTALFERLPARDPVGTMKIVYTPLHGVGWKATRSVLEKGGYTSILPVMSQLAPDESFPTIEFPNPEEPGTLELAVSQANDAQAVLVLANDPDADRLAVCVRDGQGQLRRMTGNQVGLLLADYLLRAHTAQQRSSRQQALVVSSVVSSPMLRLMAASYGAKCVSTLTGFKWILSAAAREADATHAFVFGYEEAQGYCFDGLVRDKDGISAALLFADLASECHRERHTVVERLFALYHQHGIWVSAPQTFAIDSQVVVSLLDSLTHSPPSELRGLAVTGVLDFRERAEERPGYLGAAELVELQLEGGSRVMVRPSGTEPKLKLYVDHRVDCPALDVAGREREAEAEARRIAREAAVRICGSLQ